MEWYIPITIMPGAAMLVLSTSTILIALNNEIRELNQYKDKYEWVIAKKMKQLKKLNYALIGEYLASFLLVVSGILSYIIENKDIVISIVLFSVLVLSGSIFLMIIYSFNSLKIRREHLKL